MTAILAALASAGVAGFLTNTLALRRERQKDNRDERRTKEMEEREKMGLLKLVHSEVTNNLEHLKGMGTTALEDSLKVAALRSDDWERSSTKLAELVEEDQFEHLVSCYGSLSVFKARLTTPGDDVDALTNEEHKAQVKSVTSHHWLAFDVCQKETGRFRAWSKGMLVSKPNSELDHLEEDEDDEQKAL
jgi:hypothetical protein